MNQYPVRFFTLRALCGGFLFLNMLCMSQKVMAEAITVEATYLMLIDSSEIAAQDSGIIDQVQVKEGTTVEQGDILLQLNQVEAKLDVQRAQKAYEIARIEAANEIRQSLAEKTIEVAEAELERAQQANQKFAETVSKTEIARLKLVAEKARLEFQQAVHDQEILKQNAMLAELELKIAEQALIRRTIRAPFSGVIDSLEKRPGEWVQPGSPLLRITGLSTLRAEGTLPSKYRSESLVGRKVEIKTSQKNSKGNLIVVSGEITFVLPEIDPVDGSFQVWAELDNTERALRPGETVTMKILESKVSRKTNAVEDSR